MSGAHAREPLGCRSQESHPIRSGAGAVGGSRRPRAHGRYECARPDADLGRADSGLGPAGDGLVQSKPRDGWDVLVGVRSSPPPPLDRIPRRELGYLELRFRPDAHLVSTIRRFVTALYERLIQDPEGISRVALAVHELVENAVKYSQGGSTGLRVEVFERGGSLGVAVTTRNMASREHAGVLRTMLEELNRGTDPFEAYHQAMLRSLTDEDSSRLGLARLRAEAGMQLSIEEGLDGELALVARTEVALEART